MIEKSIIIDNQQFERKLESEGRPSQWTFAESKDKPQKKHHHRSKKSKHNWDREVKATMQTFNWSKGKRGNTKGSRRGKFTCFNCGKVGHYVKDCRSKKQSVSEIERVLAVMQRDNRLNIWGSRSPSKVILEWRLFVPDHLWPPPPETPPQTVVQDAAPLFTSLDHAMLSWTACYDNKCHIHWSEKEGRFWYPQALSGPPPSVPLPVNEPPEESIAGNHDNMSVGEPPSKFDPMEDTTGWSDLTKLICENQVEVRQRRLQESYWSKINCDDFTQAEWRQWRRDMDSIMRSVGRHDYYYLTS